MGNYVSNDITYDWQWVEINSSAQYMLEEQGYKVQRRERRRGQIWLLMIKVID